MFIAAFSTIAKLWKQPKCPTTVLCPITEQHECGGTGLSESDSELNILSVPLQMLLMKCPTWTNSVQTAIICSRKMALS